jgi:hypothetical protein
MNTAKPIKLLLTTLTLSAAILVSSCAKEGFAATDDFEGQVEDYIQKFPYQDTHDYALRYTQGDPAAFNVWTLGAEPSLVKAGEDKIVRMNNDTFYKIAFLVHENGPVVLGSSAPADDRFFSFQLMDDRNANYHNVMRPKGQYTLYHGEMPQDVQGEAIEVPSNLSVVIVRVEVKDKNDPADVAAAEKVFRGITVEGPSLDSVPELDLLSGFDEKVEEEALSRIDAAFASVSFSETIVGPGQEPGTDVPYLNHAAGTKGGWGGPDPAHSAYEVLFTDAAGEVMDGSKGTYTLTTDEPQVDAFWSITAYDTERGGFFHPNDDDRYHINNTSAAKNADGTVTFTFKQKCADGDLNCLEVPAGPFDLAGRYYLPGSDIISGEWTLPRAELTE